MYFPSSSPHELCSVGGAKECLVMKMLFAVLAIFIGFQNLSDATGCDAKKFSNASLRSSWVFFILNFHKFSNIS